MTRRPGLLIGRVGGTPVHLAPTWALVAGFIVLAFGPQVQFALPRLGLGAYVVALGYAVLLAVSVLVHEIAHALVGRAHGQRAQEIVLTLWGGHTQFAGAHAGPGGTVLTAMAGPAANVVLAGLAWLAGLAVPPLSVAGLLLQMTVWANLLLAAFNALPGLPLDGGRMVESAVWVATGSRDRGTVAAGWAGRVLAVALVAAVAVPPFLRGGTPQLLPLVLAGWVAVVLWQGAGVAIERGRWGRRLDGVRLTALELPARAVDASATVTVALSGHPREAAAVAVDAGGTPRGVVDLGAVESLAPHEAALTPVTAVCRAVPPQAVHARADLPGRGADLVAALTAAETGGAGAGPDPIPVWVVTDARGGVQSVIPRAHVLAAVTTPRHPDS